MVTPASEFRDRLLDALLPIAPVTGWTSRSIKEAAQAAGLSEGEAELAAPRGPLDLIDALADRADKAALAKLAQMDLSTLKIRERVTLAVRARIEAMAGQREAVRRALAHLALLRDTASPARFAWRSADRIWRALGDRSTDGNYYSKRVILAGVLSATIAVWLADDSEGAARTWKFLDARIENVMQFERFKAQLKPAGFMGWRAIGMLASLRYGRDGARTENAA